MHYRIYIDESGPFDEAFSGVSPSVVGGVCARKTSKEWEYVHTSHLENFRRQNGTSLEYPDHYHCGPLRSGKMPVPSDTNRKSVFHFSDDVFHNVLRNADFGFVSRNSNKGFAYSPQATYVMHLVAALRSVFNVLGSSDTHVVDRIDAVIAQRTIGETARLQSVDKYMHALLGFVEDQLMLGNGPGVEMARRLRRHKHLTFTSGYGDKDPGLIAADFVCCQARNGIPIGEGEVLHEWQADPNVLLGDYRGFYERQSREFLQNRYYGSYLEFLCRYFPSTDGLVNVSDLISQLKNENDSQVLERELPTLVAAVHQLSKGRNHTANGLSNAIHIAEKFVSIASQNVEGSQSPVLRSLWLNMLIQMLAELAACYNHTGSVGPQHAVEQQLEGLLKRYTKETLLDALERQTLLHSIQNKNLNLLFNDYRFEEAYSIAEDLAVSRRKLIPAGEPDKLLGQILGSQGQACAFMAHQDGSWATVGVELLTESLSHFLEGSIQESMSRNFLSTLFWQADDLDSSMGQLDMLNKGGETTRNAGMGVFEVLSHPQAERYAFEVVNSLRLLATRRNLGLTDALESGVLDSLERTVYRIGTDHPHEQWLKWLGILHWQQSHFAQAMECFERASLLCGKQQFTMQTIGNSVTLLAFLLTRARGKKDSADAIEKVFHSDLKKLRAQSVAFDSYVSIALDPYLSTALPTVPDARKHWKFFTYLPFSYS